MHTIKYKKCVAQQDNTTLKVTVSKDGFDSVRYLCSRRLSGKELRSVVNRYLRDVEERVGA